MDRRDFLKNSALLFAALLALLLCSCARHPNGSRTSGTTTAAVKTTTPPNNVSTNGRCVVALLDATGSFGNFRDACRRLAQFVLQELQPGDTIAAFFIKDKLDDAGQFVIEPTTLPTPTRRIGDLSEVESLQLKKQMASKLYVYADPGNTPVKVTNTDLMQALADAASQLHSMADSREKWLLAFTDLEDTQRKKVTMDLHEVHVRVFFVPKRNNIEAFEKKKADWTQRFTDAKTASAEIYDVGQTLALQRLLTLSQRTTQDRARS
jgi:hypothetical protein